MRIKRKPLNKHLGIYRGYVAYDQAADWIPLPSASGSVSGVKLWLDKTYLDSSGRKKQFKIIPVAISFRNLGKIIFRKRVRP